MKGEILFQKKIKRQNYLLPVKKAAILRAVAVPVAPPSSSADSAEYRKQLSESYGFEQIGEPLPDNVRLKDIVESLPKEVLHFVATYWCLTFVREVVAFSFLLSNKILMVLSSSRI